MPLPAPEPRLDILIGSGCLLIIGGAEERIAEGLKAYLEYLLSEVSTLHITVGSCLLSLRFTPTLAAFSGGLRVPR